MVTHKYTMYVSLAFIDTFQSTLNIIIKTHFCWDKMVAISDGIFKYIFLTENVIFQMIFHWNIFLMV